MTGVPSYRVLGVRVHAVQMAEAAEIMKSWALDRARTRFVAVTGMHGVVEAQRDRKFLGVLNSADLCVADGAPVMLLGRLARHPMRRRVNGPELMETFLERTAPLGLRHFFYGGPPGLADDLARKLAIRFPDLRVAGTHSPPFGPARREDPAVLDRINASRADVVWIGLSTPKQERWMHAHRDDLLAPLLVGVGAAFDILAGRLRRAPEWMRESGLEWLFRLGQEPRRLWKRYLVGGAEFTVRVLTDLFTGRFRCTGKTGLSW